MAARLDDTRIRAESATIRVTRALADPDLPPDASIADTMRHLLSAGADRLPPPGRGSTLQRWRALEVVARRDLSLVKVYESHTDALAILDEIEPQAAPQARLVYAVWASEARTDPVTIRSPGGDGLRHASTVIIDGRKSWCSGAAIVDAGLMTAVDAAGARFLVEMRMASPGVSLDRSRWHAVGMAGSGSFDVVCDGVPARIVGGDGSYLRRPGFWHGGAGVAACWHGAAAAIGSRVRDLQAGRDDAHALAHLGAIDAALASGAALLRETAAAIDRDPMRDAMRIALRIRGHVADVCETVIHHAERAVGPGPLCNEPDFARRVADLPIFVRQSRAEHDRVAQSRALLDDAAELARDGWTL